ncbi:MAG: acyloxyacyl hydrolase [Deltaproteobacteria bacterium]
MPTGTQQRLKCLGLRDKHISSLLLCLFLILPASASSIEVPMPGLSDDGVMPSTKQRIWVSSVGDGFRSGSRNVGLSAGASYGMLVFGSNERHHLALVSASCGRMVGGVIGKHHWYGGNIELRAEVFSGAQFNATTRGLVGLTPHIRYHIATGTRLVPYLDAGAGISLTEIRGPDLGGAFQFNLQTMIGANYFVKNDISIDIAVQYLHISSSAISMPNNGVNTLGCFLGIHFFF